MAVAALPRVYALSMKQLYAQVIADVRDGKAGTIHPELYRAYSDNLHGAVSGVLSPSTYGDRYLDMQLQFEANVARFAAYKAFNVTQQLERQLADREGVERSPEEFDRMARAVLNTFNRYQAAEYNTAVSRARTAKQWADFSQGDNMMLFPNLRWIPSRSASPREEHKPFYDLVLPKTDHFWTVNQPGTLWNCKCDWEETDDPIDHRDLTPDQLAEYRTDEGSIHARGLEGNPAQTGQIFTDECTYVQKAGKGAEHDALKTIWKDNFNWALENIRGKYFKNPGIEEEIYISRRGIKEFLNQNHDDYLMKNEMIRHIEVVLGRAEYMGETYYGGRISKIFKTQLRGKDNYIIANYNDEGELNLHSISESPKVLTGIKK